MTTMPDQPMKPHAKIRSSRVYMLHIARCRYFLGSDASTSCATARLLVNPGELNPQSAIRPGRESGSKLIWKSVNPLPGGDKFGRIPA